jgi:hypothetical protein
MARQVQRRRALAALAALGLLAAACSSDDEPAADTRTEDTPDGEDESTDGAGADDAEPTTTESPDDGAAAVPERFVGHTSELYGVDENWLCRPDLATDLCHEGLTATLVAADGTTTPTELTPVEDAPVDCFYIYPTVNLAGEGSNDTAMAADIAAEAAVVRAQLAPFTTVCNVYAPIYRQVLMSGFGAGEEAFQLAYDDVADAFATYMADFNEGRPFVLMGHSQGTGMLERLIQDEIDGDEALRGQLVSALMIGGGVTVAAGDDGGGSFENVPLCTAGDQTGCVIAYNSIAATGPPAAGNRWASGAPGELRACTNPAALEGGPAPLRSIVVSAEYWVPGQAIDSVYTIFDGLVQGECRSEGELAWFEITSLATEGDARNPERLSTNQDFWDLHIVDVNLTMGNLLDLVASQVEAVAG